MIKKILIIILVVVLFGSLYKKYVAAPSNFPAPYSLTIMSGETLSDISIQLVDDHVIRSSRTFEFFMAAFGNEKNISEGEYYFGTPLSALSIAMRISGKEFGIERQKITFPEGFTNQEMADHLAIVFPYFDKAQFLALAKNSQGYLFPDTYKFFPSVMPDTIIAAMKANYQRKVATLQADITASGHSQADIIAMASLIEKEAKGDNDRDMIAGILWKRISSGIALQVDAYPPSYSVKGLPPAPIDNPGLLAIKAALHPTSSPYIYYLHDRNGAIHYASTYQEHQQNINKYLR